MMKNTFIHIMVISFTFLTCLNGQVLQSANATMKETGIFIKEFHYDWSDSSRDNNTIYSLDLHALDFGFSNLNISQIKKAKKNKINLSISGPNFNLDHLSLSARITQTNWITQERIRRLEKRQEIPKSALISIAKALELYMTDVKKAPESLNDLYVQNYLNLDTAPFDDHTWTYSLDLPEQILAQPTQIHPIADTKPIFYDWNTKEIVYDFTRDSLTEVSSVDWKYSLDIDEISHQFLSKINLTISPDTTGFSFFLQHGKLKIGNISIHATPGNQLNNRTTIYLPELVLDINRLALEGELGTKPIFHQGQGNISIRNFEIKLPKELKEEPEIQSLLESLGIWNNSFKIRLIEIELDLMDENTGELSFALQTPFLKVKVNGDFSMNQDKVHPEIILHQMVIKINPVAFGVRKWIRNWEKEKKRTLERQGGTIVLKLEGPLSKPVIHGFK